MLFPFRDNVPTRRTPVVTFGLITDTHVYDKADHSNAIAVTVSPRYFTGGLPKLEAFARALYRVRREDAYGSLNRYTHPEWRALPPKPLRVPS